ncbi:2-C-methyl-D-erythritol 4-phosphate cytidylyltransferase [Bremerella cremea]|uniref:2-C-methyl-D-erythritol 4-phosphate cytidylyltransferase n=1 Tax=Bremerella cremea TaxID=1031537 RepID=A0A368KNR5_9BACT|nr:2-C-methyl-D-erythritol 4-phosphate cytidylyltransferase [Bremerella cremea]RCS46084.1 2-C-methyl-D-erythritol 4-phosphate cytidylyltransferase [Bremerella cremea]
MIHFSVILPAAGRSTRFGGGELKKVFVSLLGQPIWLHSAKRFAARPDVNEVVVVISADDEPYFREQFAEVCQENNIRFVLGGETRTDSIANGIDALTNPGDFIAIHDAARPGIDDAMIDEVFSTAAASGAAILALPVPGTLKRSAADGTIQATVPREGIWEAQTPQVFRRALILEAYEKFRHEPATDDASLVERLGHPIQLVKGALRNLKITTKEDLEVAQKLLSPEV